MSHFNCRLAYISPTHSIHCPKISHFGHGCSQIDLVKWDPQTPVEIVNMAQWKLEKGLQGVKLHITANQ